MEQLSRPLALRALAGATAALLALGLVGVFVVDDDSSEVTSVGGTTTTQSLPDQPDEPVVPGAGEPVPGAPGAPAPGQPAPGQPGGPAPTSPATNGSGSGASAQPGALSPPRTGLYRYKLNEDGEDKRSELRITADGGSKAEPQFRYRETADGNSTESLVAWRSGGVFETARDFPSTSGEPARCDWEPDLLLAPRPLKADSAWSWDTRCTSTLEGQKAEFHFTGNARVTGAEKVAVAGQQVDSWRIETKGRIEITGNAGGRPFVVVVDIESVDNLAPERGVIVRSDTKTKVTDPAGRTRTSQAKRELQNLDPA